MSKKTTVPGVETSEPEESESEEALTREQMEEDIKGNRLIPEEYKALLIRSLDLPGRVAVLENIVTDMAGKVDGIGDDVVKKLNAAAAARQKRMAEELKGKNEGAGGSAAKSTLLDRLLIKLLTDSGSSSMDKFFWQLGQKTFFEGIAWQETFMNEQAKGMGREFVKDWKERTKKIEGEFSKVKAGDKKE